MLCCAMLCYAMLSFAMLAYAMLCCTLCYDTHSQTSTTQSQMSTRLSDQMSTPQSQRALGRVTK